MTGDELDRAYLAVRLGNAHPALLTNTVEALLEESQDVTEELLVVEEEK